MIRARVLGFHVDHDELPGLLQDAREVSALGRRQIAATTDLGVSSKCYEVLRLFPGPVTVEMAREAPDSELDWFVPQPGKIQVVGTR